MKKLILPFGFLLALTISSCGGADEVAKHALDSILKDSANKAKTTADSLAMEDSIAKASKKMKEDYIADSTKRADSMMKLGKKGE